MKATLDLFGKAIAGKSIDFRTVNELAVKVGYIVHPDCCTQEVYDWLKTKTINYNATFYKAWNDVISKSRFELFIDQIIHYATTYGTGHTGIPYIPNDGSISPEFHNLKIISVISVEEAKERAAQMLYSGVALKQETIDAIFTIVSVRDLDVQKILNKEALMVVCKQQGVLPTTSEDCVRYAIYLATGSTLLIKDRSTLTALKTSAGSIDLSKVFKNQEVLAETFFRFKPIWLAFKANSRNRSFVNKLRKLANKFHKPKAPGFWANILSDTSLLPQLEAKLPELNNYKKVALLQAILVRQKETSAQAFIIRNQKLWVQNNASENKKGHLTLVYEMLYKSLTSSISAKACKVFIPDGISLKLPTSEKSFIGNYPLGTTFDVSQDDLIIGIHWRGAEGANDLDLSLQNLNGVKIGWNASYNSGEFVFSGDMTSANPEAVELLYAKQGFKSTGVINVNLYSGATDSKFRTFIARERITSMTRNYMVDPNNILFTIDNEMNSRQKAVGIVSEGKFFLCNLRTGSQRVSRGGTDTMYAQYVYDTLDCYVDLTSTLIDAGFEVVNTPEEADIDLSNLSKDTLLNLL